MIHIIPEFRTYKNWTLHKHNFNNECMRIIDYVSRATLSTIPQYKKTQVEIVFQRNYPKQMKSLNGRYRKEYKATNVLAFPADILPPEVDFPRELGDIYICTAVVDKEAKEQGKPFLHHFSHMIVHGILHLAGHDHETDEEAYQMERKEVQILEMFGIPNPYLT